MQSAMSGSLPEFSFHHGEGKRGRKGWSYSEVSKAIRDKSFLFLDDGKCG